MEKTVTVALNDFCLVTRPKDIYLETKILLDQVNIDSFSEPLIDIHPINKKYIQKYIFQDNKFSKNILITSSQAIPYLSLFKNHVDQCDFFIVGTNTSQKITQQYNFNVKKVTSDISSMKKYLENSYRDIDSILYLSGDYVKDNLSSLNDLLTINRIIVYNTTEKEYFSQELINYIVNKNFKFIIFFSLRNTKIFYQLSKKYKLLGYLNKIICVSISNNISEYILQNMQFKNILTAESKDIYGVINKIENEK